MTHQVSSSSAPESDEAAAPARPHWRRDVTIFLSGQTVSLLGSMLVQYAVMWHLTVQTQSGGVLALAALFGFGPQAIVSIFGGVWADRLNRKVLIILADGTIALTTLALALFMINGIDSLWLIYATLAIRSAGAGIQTPAVSALIPQITPMDKLMRVNGINGSIQSAMALLAPALAGIIYANASIVTIFFIDVVTAAIGIGLLTLVTVPTIRRAADNTMGYFDDLVGGLRYIANHSFVRWLLVLFAIVFVLTVAPSYLTMLMVVRSFGGVDWPIFGTGLVIGDDVTMLAVTEVSFSVGMMLGGIAIAIWAGSRNRVAMIVAAALIFGGLSIGLGLSTNLWVFFAMMFLIGIAVPFFSTPSMTLLQERVEPEMQGRVFGFVGIVMAVAMPLGMVVFGPLADLFDVELLLIIAGVLTFIVVGIAVLVPSGRRAMKAASLHEAPAAD